VGVAAVRATTTTEAAAEATAVVAAAETMAGTTESVPLRSARAARWSSLFSRTYRRLHWLPTSLRTRIVVWFIAVLAFSMAASVFVIYQALLFRIDQRIDAALTQEADELRALVDKGGLGANARRIFRVYLQRNVPSENEALITFLDGRPFLRSRQVVPYRLDQDSRLVGQWSTVAETKRGRAETPAGRVEYLAVPLLEKRERTKGVFVAAIFRDREKSEVNAVVLAAGGVGLAILVLGSLLAWRLADRVVKPVTALTTTARSISETDLSARIPERGRDEVAQLAATFNLMLGRLERAFESQRRFLDDAGHELKTPLTIVRGHLELLDDDPEERRAAIALMTDELDRMARIVGDVMLLARHDRPDFLSLSTVDVASLTEELQAKAKALAPRDWVLERRARGVIVADRHRLTQAVMQLAQNAARFSAEGEPIELGSSIDGREARFWVRDHGPGVPASEQQLIFERFRRGSHHRRSEGAGLGLAIVKAIAEAHHGRVELSSRPGEGATFTLVVAVDPPIEPKDGDG
jgi:signal transduction histidine kinase